MKTILYAFTLFFILLSSCNSQTNKESIKVKNTTNIDETYKLGFIDFDKDAGLYRRPIIIVNNNRYSIDGYDIYNYSDGNIISISPNHKFIILDYIIRDYVSKDNQKILHENYLCVIVSLEKHKVVLQMQSDCGGEWNDKNQWTNNDKIIFDGIK